MSDPLVGTGRAGSAKGLRWTSFRRAALVLCLWVLVLPQSAEAGLSSIVQVAESPPTLDRVEGLMGQGRTQEARDALQQWWTSLGPAADGPDTQRALWLDARLTLDPAAAAVLYRRLILEYPDGPYAPQARSRLAQAEIAWAALEAGGIEGTLEDEDATSPAPPYLTAAAPASDAQPTDEPARAPVEDEPQDDPAPTPTPGGAYAVQVGAYLSRARADRMVERAAERGFDARIVTVSGSPLFRVRIGIYRSLDNASAMADAVAAEGFDTLIVSDASTEHPLGS